MSNSGKATLENSIKGDIDLELGGKTEQVQTTGKNLANPSEFVIGTLAGDTGNIINLKQYITTGYIPVIPGKRYSTSCGNKFSAHTIIAYDKEKTKINSPINMSSEMPEGAAYIRRAYRKIDMTNVTESDMEELKKVCMVNEGSTVLPYEPYTGLKPSPSPEYQQEIKNSGKLNEETQKYEVDVKVTGKNLFNVNQFENPENIIGRKDFVLQPSEFKAGAAYFCSAKVKGDMDTLNRVRIDLFYEDGSKDGYYGNETSSGITKKSFMVRTTSKLIKIVFILQGDTNTKWTDVMIEYGDKMTYYEPYQEPQTLTLTSDHPLTKWDKLVEQGGQYGWLYKHRIVNNLSALVKDSEPIYGKDGEKYFSVSLQGALFNYDYNKIYSVAGMCPKDSKIYYVPKPMIQSVIIYVSDTDTIMTAKEHMHYKVIYETTESQFVSLSESEQTQLRNLHSYNGTTHITADSGEVPCGIKVAYKQKK